MALVLDATIGGAAANAYADVAFADAYHEGHVSTKHAVTWTESGASDKAIALVHATRLLDIHFEWNGTTASETQALLHPRYGLTGPSGFAVPSSEIARLVKQATCELARQLLAEDRTADPDQVGIKRLKAGPVDIEFAGSASARAIPDSVADMLVAFGRRKAGRMASVPLVRV